jgi:hypothetical protein
VRPGDDRAPWEDRGPLTRGEPRVGPNMPRQMYGGSYASHAQLTCMVGLCCASLMASSPRRLGSLQARSRRWPRRSRPQRARVPR